jgi:hypothetical protein
MKTKHLILLLILSLVFANLSCGGNSSGEHETEPATRGNPQKLAEALASREQENPPPLTMLQAYQIAQARATKWHENSYFSDMSASINEDISYYYYSFSIYNPTSAGIQCEKRRSDIEVLSMRVEPYTGGMVEESSGFPGLGYGRLDPNSWLIDSPQALEIANASGGDAFKDKYPEFRIGFGADGFIKCWVISYREAFSPGEAGALLQIQVDPYTGEATITENTM